MKELQRHDYAICKEGICTCLCPRCYDNCTGGKRAQPKPGMAGRRDTMMRKGNNVRTKGHGDDTR